MKHIKIVQQKTVYPEIWYSFLTLPNIRNEKEIVGERRADSFMHVLVQTVWNWISINIPVNNLLPTGKNPWWHSIFDSTKNSLCHSDEGRHGFWDTPPIDRYVSHPIPMLFVMQKMVENTIGFLIHFREWIIFSSELSDHFLKFITKKKKS